MGHILGKHFHKPPQVLLMGLDAAGKSTLLYKLQLGVTMETTPTVGFNAVTLELDKNTLLTVWDVGGQSTMRPNWRYYLEGCRALVFVVDGADRARLPEAKRALHKVLADANMKGVPLMVLANKAELPDAVPIQQLSEQLDLGGVKDRKWEIQACSALKGLGLRQAFLSVAKLIGKT